MELKDYQKKRKFNSTPEPKGSGKQKSGNQTIFLIQKHQASQLHYDFRLEIDGVLVSWAVPKGPSTDPKEKKLAIRTEDHPLEYADFEGIIPKDQYGGGTVIIWDKGTYQNQRGKKMSESLKEGKIEVWLKGKKLQGGYHLIKMKQKDQDKEQWLLFKAKDEEADARRNPASTEPKSVKSDQTIQQVRGRMSPTAVAKNNT